MRRSAYTIDQPEHIVGDGVGSARNRILTNAVSAECSAVADFP
jgi:hypothetical protein